mmetsp:Transcript_41376/g.80846  ORF Transcript_41376/g.80846 Transcript_41376/m.80846 type:complete len:203 (-) Transcript_41376:283-891(-)
MGGGTRRPSWRPPPPTARLDGKPPKTKAQGVNASLEHLDLSYNEVLSDACLDIARAIQLSPSLAHLGLSGNPIGDSGALKVLSGCHAGSKLRKVEMRACGLSRSGPIPVDAVSEDSALAMDNVFILREIIPEALGTLPMPAAAKPVRKVMSLAELRSSGDGGWNSQTKLEAPPPHRAPRRQAAQNQGAGGQRVVGASRSVVQ